MADVICPNCGKNTPAELELCQFCSAPLEPVEGTPQGGNEDLLNLFGSSEDSGEVPDWLRDLRPEDQTETGIPGESAEQPGDLTADWQLDETAAGMPPAESSPEEDWLARLEEGAVPDFSMDAGPEPAKPEPVESLPTDEQADSLAIEEPSGEQPVQEPVGPQGSSYDETLDWLASLEKGPSPDETSRAPDEPLGTGELSDLNFEFNDTSETEPVIPQEEAAEEGAAPQAQDEFAADENWLERLGEAGFEEQALSQPQAAETGSPESPVSPFTFDTEEPEMEASAPADWFAGEAQQPAGEEDLPDWLRQAGEGETPFGERSPQESSAPDWLTGGFESKQAAIPDELTPDWLEQMGEPAGAAETVPAEETVPAAETPPAESDFAALPMEEGKVPEWLAEIDQTAVPGVSEGSVPAFIPDEEASPFELEKPLEETASVGEFGQAPDWLDQISTSQEPGALEQPPLEPAEAGLAPAELPGWLESMRPSEAESTGTIFRDSSDSRIESAGLLAGVPGILPVEREVSRVGKPPVYSNKLHIAQEQQDRVDMLKELLADEVRIPAKAAPAAIPTVYILRLLILGAFIFGAIFAFWSGVQQTPTPGPGSIPQEVLDLRQALDQVENGAPVLVAFDYEPASAPEMEAAAMGVLDQLMLKGSVIRAVSTTHSGPALAKRMLEQVLNMPDRAQTPPVNYAILGYIPGGAAGLQAFARNPASEMRYNLEGTELSNLDAWAEPTFDPAAGLANFHLALVITDNADTARSWVEQTGLQLQQANVPLVMVVSAQAEPMVRPYYETNPRQIAGMATGVMGGVFVESLNGRQGTARIYMDAYSLTLMVAVVLLVIGSLVNLVSNQMALNKKLKGEGKA